MPALPIGRLLVASVIAAIIGVGGLLVSPTSDEPVSNIHVEVPTTAITVGETFYANISVEATEPVNVFAGLLSFDSKKLEITAIDYNVSIADLWAERPWYSNGDGTLNFTGGTTKPGGFDGKDILITVTFKAKVPGETNIFMSDVHLLRHDGLGTEARIGEPIDSILTIEPLVPEIKTSNEQNTKSIQIISNKKSTDLNNDGEQTIADLSIFMAHLATQDASSDFNEDGRIDLKDLSVLLEQ